MPDTWLSEDAHARLQSEFDDLTGRGREDIAKEIEEARSHGDLKENAEYHAAKEEQGRMEARIRQLKQLLDNARVGTPPQGKGVQPGLTVRITIDGDEEEYLVGSREDTHDTLEILSAESPIGKAILSRQVGDTATALLPNGTQVSIEVLEIEIA
jgi:transcription elongation factor GreA